MQALRNVFDTNGDGVFDAADARWAQFKLLVTNPDGTRTALTMAQAGITSINLKTDTTHISYSDGSAITGTATTLATDGRGYAIQTTRSPEGTTTTTATNADGSTAFMETTTTTANTQTISTDENGDGVVERRSHPTQHPTRWLPQNDNAAPPAAKHAA